MKKRTMPYGYEIRNGEITVNPKAEQIIKEIFKAYLDGMSFGNIADEMTYRGVDYYDGKKTWNKLMVKRILECRHYLGTEKYPPIISHEQFESVAMLIAAKYGGYNKDPRATILKKRTFCQECGERITRDIQSARYHKWYCKGCLETALREERFYERILSALNAVIAHPELLDEVEPKDTYESDFDITRKSSELNHMLNNTHVDFEQTFEDKATYQTYVEALKNQNMFTEEAQKEALTRAKNMVLTQLSKDSQSFIESNFGNVETWIQESIEAVLYDLKNKPQTSTEE